MRSTRLATVIVAAALSTGSPALAVLHLTGKYIDLPIDTTDEIGRFMEEGNAQGAKFNPRGTGGATGIDFWVWGTPVYNYSIAFGGLPASTNGFGWSSGPTVMDTSSGTTHSAVISGSPFADLSFTRVVSFADDAKAISITDTLTNLNDGTFTQVATLDNTDPDQGTPLNGDARTFNDVTANSVIATVKAPPFPNGLSVAFVSDSSFAVFDASGFDNRDPYPIIASPQDPNGALNDIGIDIAFNYGTLGAFASKSATWEIVFAGIPVVTSEAPALSPSGLLVTMGLLSAIAYWGLRRRDAHRTRS